MQKIVKLAKKQKKLNIKTLDKGNYRNVKELCKILNLSMSFVYQLVQENKIPHIRMARRKVLFDMVDVNEWVESFKVKPKVKIKKP